MPIFAYYLMIIMILVSQKVSIASIISVRKKSFRCRTFLIKSKYSKFFVRVSISYLFSHKLFNLEFITGEYFWLFLRFQYLIIIYFSLGRNSFNLTQEMVFYLMVKAWATQVFSERIW